MSDNITLPREVVEFVLQVLEKGVTFKPGWVPECEDATATLHNYLAAPRPEPSGYAYRYNDGVLRFNGGSTINGAPPIEVLPYWFAPPTAAPSEDIDALRQELAAVLSDWNSLVCASGSSTNGGAVGHVAALRREAERYRWLRGEHSRIDPCIKAVCKHPLQRQGHTWAEIHDLDAIFDAAMGDKT